MKENKDFENYKTGKSKPTLSPRVQKCCGPLLALLFVFLPNLKYMQIVLYKPFISGVICSHNF